LSEFVEYLKEVFEEFGPVQARRMFGGYGIYHNGVMFGLVADDTLYLKADETTAQYFHSKGLGQFEYEKGEKKVKMSYYLAPDEVLENPGEAKLWAERAYEVAVRTNARKRKKQKSAKRLNR
jgi:DNA transformation protein